MFGIPTFEEQFTKLDELETHEERLIKVLEIYLKNFPVSNVYLCRYSPIGFLGEGVIALEDNELRYIHNERYDVRTVPAIMTAIKEKRAVFVGRKDLFKITSSNYILNKNLSGFLVSPILQRGNVIAFLYTYIFENIEIKDELLESMAQFSKEVGERINETYAEQKLLSKREFEVMKQIADGISTKEIAINLALSELTIKQYVKLARAKLGASNRAHAIANMYRLGIL